MVHASDSPPLPSIRQASKIYVIGSTNIDHIYHCKSLPSSGFCSLAPEYSREIGGKGLNQAYALFQAGVKDVKFGGIIGEDGVWIKEFLKSVEFPIDHMKISSECATGNCVIFNREFEGEENAFMLHLGANATFDLDVYQEILKDAQPSDILVVQNESNLVGNLLVLAKNKGMTTVFNPAPIPPPCPLDDWVERYPTDVLILNKLEAEKMAQSFGLFIPEYASNNHLVASLRKSIEAKLVVMTCGKDGVFASLDLAENIHSPAIETVVVDSTGAGDSFLGYFIAALSQGFSLECALRRGIVAATLCISKPGTLKAIPDLRSVEEFDNCQK